MTYLLLAIHLLVCIALIGIVLIQGGKGADIGAAFGAGASNTVFGATGAQSFLGKMTTGAAIIFMLTSLALAIFWGQPGSSSIMPQEVTPTSAQTAPMQAVETPAAAPASDQAATPAAPAAEPTQEAPGKEAK